MKIAFVYDAVYPWVKGGAEKRIYELGRRLAVQGDDVHLFGLKWWQGEDIILHEGMVLHGVSAARELYAGDRRSISEAIIFASSLYSGLMREKFDLIDVSVFPYFPCFTVKLVSAIRRTPVLYTWHEVWDDYWYEYMGKAGFFGKVVEKAISRISDSSIAVSELTGKRLQSLGVPKKNISVVPNGIDLGYITGTAQAELSGPDPVRKSYDLVFAGRLIREKNVDVLIRVTLLLKEEFPGVRCLVIGDGPQKEELVKLALRLGVSENVEFTGFTDYGSLIEKLRDSKVFLLPSSREGFGISVIEAYACGIPVITVNKEHNAAQYLVSHGVDGFVMPPDEKEIAEKIRTLFSAGCYDNLSRAARKKAEQYNWDIILEQFRQSAGIIHA